MSYPSGGAHCHVLQGRLAKHLKKIRYRTRTATRAIFAKTRTSYAWVWLSEGSASGARSWGWGREASRCSPQLGTSASTRDLQGLQRPQSRHAAIIPSVQQAPSFALLFTGKRCVTQPRALRQHQECSELGFVRAGQLQPPSCHWKMYLRALPAH